MSRAPSGVCQRQSAISAGRLRDGSSFPTSAALASSLFRSSLWALGSGVRVGERGGRSMKVRDEVAVVALDDGEDVCAGVLEGSDVSVAVSAGSELVVSDSISRSDSTLTSASIDTGDSR